MKTRKEIGLDIKASHENIMSKPKTGYIGKGYVIYDSHEVTENIISILRDKYLKNKLDERDVSYQTLKELSLFVTFNEPKEVEVTKTYGIKYYNYKE